ncbi:MAG: hypothetical protein NTY53_06990, partial [Kiritimatiellaeota bacterium]|nr:hypothetical protein [Kiritimatiellota bacterium]
ETFLLVGENLTANLFVWGESAQSPTGQEWKPRVQFLTNGLLAATLPQKAQDGVFLVWVKNEHGWSAPVVLNAPQPWWCRVERGGLAHIFGRNLTCRPDGRRAFVYFAQPGKPGHWGFVTSASNYKVDFFSTDDLEAGEYQVWIHAGSGGEFGWGDPVTIRINNTPEGKETLLPAEATATEIQAALDAKARSGGGKVSLHQTTINVATTLRIPAGVHLAGARQGRARLQFVTDSAVPLPRISGGGWGQAPGAIHTIGDTMEYQLDVPAAGTWNVWVRYGTDMSPWKKAGVSDCYTLAVDGGEPVWLKNLENTGSFGAFKWTKSAEMKLTKGRHTLVWKNVKGGGASLDAFVFALDQKFVPTQNPPPSNSPTVVVVQGENCTRFAAKDGNLPGGDHAAIWLAGDGASISDLEVFGDARLNIGIAIRSPQPLQWQMDNHVENVLVADCEGKQAENCGVQVHNAERAVVHNCELFGRTPLFISGARRSTFRGNRLVSVTRFGGNAEAAILGRCEPIEECVIEYNRIISPPGAGAGGPTARRLLWFSTGHGSIVHNWIADNGVEEANKAGQARFGGVAGTDQNVGEMILFEGNHRTAYFGPLAAADAQSVTLPKTIPATPENRLGNVKREQLAHDAAGNETPFWPPNVDDGSDEPPLREYFVTILSGRGQGQTRRVTGRADENLLLDRPWRVAPAAGSVVAVATMFHQNLIVGNHTPDGMTGIQLWISCVENVIAGNTIARQRKPGLYLYGNGTTLASSMPRTWNRGISPLFWNVAEGNRVEECSAGALVTSGDSPTLPVEFPRALGNVLRHNSFIRSRTDGVVLTGRSPAKGVTDTSASVAGTIVEFNVVRDATTAYHAAASADATVLRRNHAYFWYPVNNSTNAPVAFALDSTNTTCAIEQNSIEGIHGVHDTRIIDLKTPAGNQRLPEK